MKLSFINYLKDKGKFMGITLPRWSYFIGFGLINAQNGTKNRSDSLAFLLYFIVGVGLALLVGFAYYDIEDKYKLNADLKKPNTISKVIKIAIYSIIILVAVFLLA